jgi:hypothetical protein
MNWKLLARTAATSILSWGLLDYAFAATVALLAAIAAVCLYVVGFALTSIHSWGLLHYVFAAAVALFAANAAVYLYVEDCENP